ncbi:hypothetical protein GIB67_032746 [Kingdonia uniflora]|uniref:Homeobox transcription factor KN3 n=1 Tax=Kingdonia uniflora TaxID=39325 RepID=A0A7J7MW17_9MAGN|nr:hypothetical protein GIB67_032746 [Kingdonia uniflora]
MESGGGLGSNSCFMGYGDNGLSSMVMMMPPPLMNSCSNLDENITLAALPLISNHNFNTNSSNNTACYFMESNKEDSIRAKIMSHPHYPRLITAYVNCQKIGAPPEVVAKLEEASAAADEMSRIRTGCIGEDPSLDQFMEAYCEMLMKYEEELTKPFKEAMLFLSKIESQLSALNVGSSDSGDTLVLSCYFTAMFCVSLLHILYSCNKKEYIK